MYGKLDIVIMFTGNSMGKLQLSFSACLATSPATHILLYMCILSTLSEWGADTIPFRHLVNNMQAGERFCNLCIVLALLCVISSVTCVCLTNKVI